MRRIHGLTLIALTLAVAGLAVECYGQGPVRYPSNPAYGNVSPYLNLLRTGGMASNYYGLVQPQVETNRALQQQEAQLQGIRSRMAADQRKEQGVFQTGHRTGFLEYSHYYTQPNRRR